jgi:two-component system CheB/CheR fusion protein
MAGETPASVGGTREGAGMSDSSSATGKGGPEGARRRSGGSGKRSARRSAATPKKAAGTGFPIVGIGASAGGLAALEELFAALPGDRLPGIAFVVVQHLDPDHKSLLVDLMRRHTTLPVHVVTDGVTVQPDAVYVIPPSKDMALLDGRLHLLDPGAPRGLRLPIDFFFRSLAQDQRERAICVVLSGTGTDGTLGLTAIKGEGGMAMVQAPESAGYDGMPRSAIATGLADYVLPPAEMPAQLLDYARRAYGSDRPRDAGPPAAEHTLQKVLVLLRAQTGHDFSQYKQTTIRRRIERRMAVTQIGHLSDYVSLLQRDPTEIETLFRELLIGVTTFFRDPAAFEALAKKALPELTGAAPHEAALRIWVPACSSGEEAYSIAIALLEHADTLPEPVGLQVFATDIDAAAIERARTGVYPESIAADVSPDRLSRYFMRDGDTYRVKKRVRDAAIFATHDIARDPPFSRLDLISCRNLLIYLEGALQQRILQLFHYALNDSGFLLLGGSETIGDATQLFSIVDKKAKLYRSRGHLVPRTAVGLPPAQPARQAALGGATADHAGGVKTDLRELAQRALLADHTPACVIVNAEAEVLYIHGHTGRFLEPAPGETSVNLLRMAREGLRMELTTALRKATSSGTPVRCEGLHVRGNGPTSTVNVTVRPLSEPEHPTGRLFMVVFEDVPAPADDAPPHVTESRTDPADHRVAELERELTAKEEYLQATVEELETANEELKSSNEELQSTNEELQSTNEELETSKEELQSVNEELMTVNAELQQKIDELGQTGSDMSNLMAATGIGTVYVDQHLRIQRFTPAVTRLINLIPGDVGRPVSDIVSRLVGYDSIDQDVQHVLDDLVPLEAEVRTQEGQWFLLRIQPYRTLENVIEGAVLTFVEITAQKELQQQLRESVREAEAAQALAQSVTDTVREPLLVLDGELRVVSANRAFLKVFALAADMVIGRSLPETMGAGWKPELRTHLDRVAADGKGQSRSQDFQIALDVPGSGSRRFAVNAREVASRGGEEAGIDAQKRLILLTLHDAEAV